MQSQNILKHQQSLFTGGPRAVQKLDIGAPSGKVITSAPNALKADQRLTVTPMMSGARVPQMGKKYIPTAQAPVKTNFFSKFMTQPAPQVQKSHAPPGVNTKMAQVPNFMAARNAAIASVAAMTIATAPQQAMAADIESG